MYRRSYFSIIPLNKIKKDNPTKISPEFSVDVHGEEGVEEPGEAEGGEGQGVAGELEVAVRGLEAQSASVAGGKRSRGDLLKWREHEKSERSKAKQASTSESNKQSIVSK